MTVLLDNISISFFSHKKEYLLLKLFNTVCFDVFLEDEMLQHVMSQNILENHRTQLIKIIIKCYVNKKLFYKAKCVIHLLKENYKV